MYVLQSDFYQALSNLEEKAGPVAIGGVINPESLIRFYALGIFPWNSERETLMWYSPDPRMVVKPIDVKISKNLRKVIHNQIFECKFDLDFESVIDHCANVKRKEGNGTWITKDIRKSFIELHQRGLVHSVETYRNENLVGGLYGLSLGRVFFGESMFHLEADASKVAFYNLVNFLINNNFDLIDAQQETPYLASFGAKAIPRKSFLEILEPSVQKTTLIGNWGGNFEEIKMIEIINKENTNE
jgi:leucyl/phenylalanyl-tRNA--protein transferase